MSSKWLRLLSLGLLVAALAFAGCGSGSDGRDGIDGEDGEDGLPGPTVINASTVSDEFLEGLDVVSEITSVEVASPPVVTFTLASSTGVPITGIVPFWEDSSSYVRFTMTKLVPGTGGDPDSWVAYTRDADTNAPDYDTGSSLVDNGDGSYVFTFNTDVMAVPGVPWEPDLTHRVAGQLGSRSVPIEPQNFLWDYVPAGGAIVDTRNIAIMETCNECHDDLVFHGRRFLVEYCVQCHNPDLAEGEGDMSYMIHKIHTSGTFEVLDDAIDYSHVTYPQDPNNCRKCHREGLADAPDAGNWLTVPSLAACFGCHAPEDHPGGAPPADNSGCAGCHPSDSIEGYHLTANATPNNPNLLPGQVNITYELNDASVAAGGDVTVNLRILSDGTPLDVANLPADIAAPGRYPGLLLAWALPQDTIEEPMDYNNIGRRGAQPLSLGLDGFLAGGATGTHMYDGGTGINTFVVTDPASQFPMGATLRAVGLQGYFQQDIGGDTVSLHTPSAVVAVDGDDERRTVVDNGKCASCHEWFEGHGGNRTYDIAICTLCHNPNQSSSGRTVTDPTARGLDVDLQAAIDDGSLDDSVDPNDPLTYPEDAQNLKDLVHGIHAHAFRTRHYQHIRGPGRQGYYDWSHITFPRGASTANCSLCHDGDSYELPLAEDLLATTVRTTSVSDGMDPDAGAVESAFVNVPNGPDWINTPTAASCFMCHTSDDARAHMMQNGALLSDPSLPLGMYPMNRWELGNPAVYESCTVCHGPGKSADIEVVHGD